MFLKIAIFGRYANTSERKYECSDTAHNYGNGKCILHAKKDEGHGCGGPAAAAGQPNALDTSS